MKSGVFRLIHGIFLERQSLLLIHLSFIYKGSYLLDQRHPVRSDLWKDQPIVQQDLESSSWGEQILQHVEAEVPAQKEKHFICLESLVEWVLSNDRDEFTSDFDHHKFYLLHWDGFAEECSGAGKGDTADRLLGLSGA